MSYNKTIWENLPSTNTPLSANNLNKIENEIELLAGKAITTTGTNLNDYTTEGIYYFGTSVAPINIPNGSNGWLVVFQNGDWIKQIWFRHGSIVGNNDFQTYVRTKVDSSNWTNWRRYTIEDEIYYQSGDTISINGAILTGYVTNGTQTIAISLNTPKKLNNISSLNISLLVGNIRGINGYIDSDNTATTNFNSGEFTTTINKKSDNMITMEIVKTSAFTNATNNTPVSAFLNLQISLS